MKIIVIGGGAAGCFAAIKAAKDGHQVVLLEKGDRIGKKILVTGNGKCNLTNLYVKATDYVSESATKNYFISDIFNQFGSKETCNYFGELGLLTKAKENLVYPYCGQASAVLDTLRFQLDTMKVQIITDCQILSMEKNDLFRLVTSKGEWKADKVIICCGGKAAPKTGSDGSLFPLIQKMGHHMNPMYPALVQLQCEGDFFGKVNGVRLDGMITVTQKDMVWEEKGEIQITEHGISGIPTFQLSLSIAPYLIKGKMKAKIDFIPDLSDGELLLEFIRRKEKWSEQLSAEEAFSGILHKKVLLQLLKMCGMKPQEPLRNINKLQLKQLAELIKNFDIVIIRSNSFDQAQVSRGGIRLEELNENLESKIIPGLFFAGEIIDITGRCGGYNLQWAWSSAYIAASDREKRRKNA